MTYVVLSTTGGMDLAADNFDEIHRQFNRSPPSWLIRICSFNIYSSNWSSIVATEANGSVVQSG